MAETWRPARLSDYVDIAIGGTPSRNVASFWAEKPDGYPWLAISDLQSKYVSDTREHISGSGVRNSNAKLIPKATAVMSFKLSVGRTALTSAEMYSNEAIAAFVPRHARVIDSAWLYYVLPRAAGSVVTDTAVKGATLNKAKLAEMMLDLPRYDEQCAIRRVLDTLDTAIDRTEAIIAKLRLVKQGLLHDLLTRGIDANGELRPPQSQAPHLYKPSPLGWIPQEWDFGGVASYLSGEDGIKPGPFGSSIKKDSYSQTGFKVYGQEQVIGGDQDAGSYFVQLQKFRELQDFAVEAGDSLISLVGTVGKVMVLRDPLVAGLINPRLMRLRPDKTVVLPQFLGTLLASDLFVRQIVANAGGGTMPVINKRIVSTIRVPVVPVGEQAEIVRRRDAMDRRIACESVELAKRQKQRSGLMDDLLTGRVRVTPMLEAAAAP
jgi:type I restriction enzyme S subunit